MGCATTGGGGGGTAAIVIENDCVASGAMPLLAVTTPANVPTAVGGPVIVPAFESVSQVGNAPDVTENVIGVVPLAVYVKL